MSHQDTATKLRRIANTFQGILDAADAFEALGSVETVTAEATAARDKAVAERDSAQAELQSLRTQIDAERAAADEAARTTRLLVETQAAQAIQQAKDEAVSKAGEIVRVANDAASELANQMQASYAQAKEALDAALAEKARLDSVSAQLALDVADLRTEYDLLQAAIRDLRSKFN